MKRKGFTLIELLIVVTIIGILAVALVPRIIGGSAAARDARRQTDLQTISTGLEYYLNDNASFDNINGGAFGAGEGFCSSADQFAIDLSSFLKSIPSDPLSGNVNNICTGSYEIFLLEDSNGRLTRYAVIAQLESPEVGDEYVFKILPGEGDYNGFVQELESYPYEAGGDGYFVIY